MKSKILYIMAGLVLLVFAGIVLVVFKPFRGAPDRETHDPKLVNQHPADQVRYFNYRENARILVVYFEAASRMDFKDVPPEVGQQAMDADDQTGFFQKQILGKFDL